MLEGHVWRDGARIFEGFALNDVVVSRGATAGMVELQIEIDGEFVANLRADGLIVGSPTGSTAYALSAGGPILHPGIAGWVLVPIAPHDLSNRPIVLPDSGDVAIEIVAGRDASANFDMQSLTSLLHGDRIRVRRSAAPRALPASARLELLRDPARKLHWATGGATPSACTAAAGSRPRRSTDRMLQRLAIRDFVIVDALEIELGAGFSVLTGETGAGKSILIDALQLALGGRGDAGVVREGAARAEITRRVRCAARRSPPGSTRPASRPTRRRRRCCCAARSTRKARAAPGSTAAPPRSRSCARPADHLVDIHGQHAWQSLTRAGRRCAPCSTRYARVDARAAGRRLGRAGATPREALAAASATQGELERERERLAWQIGEIDKLAPGDDEWPELERRAQAPGATPSR